MPVYTMFTVTYTVHTMYTHVNVYNAYSDTMYMTYIMYANVYVHSVQWYNVCNTRYGVIQCIQYIQMSNLYTPKKRKRKEKSQHCRWLEETPAWRFQARVSVHGPLSGPRFTLLSEVPCPCPVHPRGPACQLQSWFCPGVAAPAAGLSAPVRFTSWAGGCRILREG